MLCYPNTLAQISWKTNTEICGFKAPRLRAMFWAAFMFSISFLFFRNAFGGIFLPLTIISWSGLCLTYVWSIFVLHKSVQENQRLRPVCVEGDNACIACCCVGCAVNQIAHQVDIKPYSWIDFSELEVIEAGYSTAPSQAPEPVRGMERDGSDTVYQPPISIKETASVSEDESAMPPDSEVENYEGFNTTDPL